MTIVGLGEALLEDIFVLLEDQVEEEETTVGVVWLTGGMLLEEMGVSEVVDRIEELGEDAGDCGVELPGCTGVKLEEAAELETTSQEPYIGRHPVPQ